MLFPFCLGTVLGSLAGYFGGWTDAIIMRLVDIVVAFPFYVLIIALVFVLGPGLRSISSRSRSWAGSPTRGSSAAKSWWPSGRTTSWPPGPAGCPASRIMARHLLPNVITQAIIYAMSDIVQDMLAIVTLGYFGLGVPPPTPDWGSMIADGQNFLTTHWQLTTFPGLAVVVVGLGLSLIGDGLADLIRPGQS